jgi:dipeptidyl aminopeptidase/acylaminoacyl peptidase
MAHFRVFLLILPTLALLVSGCESTSPLEPENGDVVGGVDLAVLFAPPTSAERTAIQADWAQRVPEAVGIEEEHAEGATIGGVPAHVRIVSHLVDGHRHFGAIIEPASEPAGELPVLIFTHGGDQGVSVDEVLFVAGALGMTADEFVFAVPSFRSEPLHLGESTWQSAGPSSPWDRDADDALSFLEVALLTTPFADPGRIGVLGLSRGGTTGLLMGIRDPRISSVVSYFAPTDFFGPFVEEVVRETLLERPPELPGIDFLVNRIVERLQDGTLSVEDGRLELLRRSPAWFADRLPSVQLHHGTADTVVPVDEAHRLVGAMEDLGRGPPEFEAHLYSGAGHNPLHMPQSLPRVRAFMETFVKGGVPTAVAMESPGYR